MDILKLIIASISFVLLVLGIWSEHYGLGCYMLFSPLIILVLISYSFIELKMHERRCFQECYFESKTLFAKMLLSPIFVTIFYLIASIFMMLSAIYISVEFDRQIWIYIALHILFCVLVYRYFLLSLDGVVKDKSRRLFAREWSINVGAILFVLVYVYFTIYEYEPSYLQSGLDESFGGASESISSSCVISNYILKLQRELDAIFWWAVDRSTQSISQKFINYAIWFAFLVTNSFAVLGINRFIVQSIYLIDKIFKMKAKDG